MINKRMKRWTKNNEWKIMMKMIMIDEKNDDWKKVILKK